MRLLKRLWACALEVAGSSSALPVHTSTDYSGDIGVRGINGLYGRQVTTVFHKVSGFLSDEQDIIISRVYWLSPVGQMSLVKRLHLGGSNKDSIRFHGGLLKPEPASAMMLSREPGHFLWHFGKPIFSVLLLQGSPCFAAQG